MITCTQSPRWSREYPCRRLSPPGNGGSLEIGTGQVVEQDVERNVEQVAPTPDQMVEQRLFEFEQPIVTAVELVDLRQSDILAQQVGHGAALEPLAMQAPL